MEPVTIRTQRDDVVLRQFTVNDVPALWCLINENRKYLETWDEMSPEYADENSLRHNIILYNNSYLRMGVWARGEMVGVIKAVPIHIGNKHSIEIGYWLGEEYTGLCYMSTAVRSFVSHIFSTLVHKQITATVKKKNLPSRNLLERVGFCKTEESRSYEHYRLDRQQWP